MRYYLAGLFLLVALPVQAAVLLWDTPTTGLITVERGITETGPFEFVATIPVLPVRQFPLLSGNWGFYRIMQAGRSSNVVRFGLDLYTGTISDRLDALEARVNVLAVPITPLPPAQPISNFTITNIDADHVQLVCLGIGITTSGSGTSRVLTCRH